MEHKLNGTLKFTLIIIALIVGLLLIKVDAQTKETKEKLKDIKEANKITITTENGDVVIEGEDAEALLKKMKSGTLLNKFKFLSTKDFDDDNLFFFDGDSGEFEFDVLVEDEGHDFEWFGDGDGERIEVRKNDGELKIIHKKNEDGKEETKTYEGEEAEKYLEDLKKEKNIDFIWDGDDKTIIIGDESKVWVTEGDEDASEIEVRVKSKVDSDKKKIIIKKLETKKEKK